MDMRALLGLVLGCLFAIGCTQTEAPAVRDYIIGDESFTPTERAEIMKGAAFITAATGRAVPEIRWEPLRSVDEDMTIKRWHFEPGHLGNCNIGHFWAAIDPSQTAPEKMADVAAHELGHGLGLEHIDGDGTMNPAAHPGLTWSDADEESCVRLGVCTSR